MSIQFYKWSIRAAVEIIIHGPMWLYSSLFTVYSVWALCCMTQEWMVKEGNVKSGFSLPADIMALYDHASSQMHQSLHIKHIERLTNMHTHSPRTHRHFLVHECFIVRGFHHIERIWAFVNTWQSATHREAPKHPDKITRRRNLWDQTSNN